MFIDTPHGGQRKLPHPRSESATVNKLDPSVKPQGGKERDQLPSEGGTVIIALLVFARLLVVIPAYPSTRVARSTTQECEDRSSKRQQKQMCSPQELSDHFPSEGGTSNALLDRSGYEVHPTGAREILLRS